MARVSSAISVPIGQHVISPEHVAQQVALVLLNSRSMIVCMFWLLRNCSKDLKSYPSHGVVLDCSLASNNRGGSHNLGRYSLAKRRRVGAFAGAGACGVAGLVAREGAHGALVQVEAHAVYGRESRA